MVSALVDIDGGLASALAVIGCIVLVVAFLLIARVAMRGTMKKGS